MNWLKSIKTKAVFTKTELNKETLIFLKITPLVFNTLILVNFPYAKILVWFDGISTLAGYLKPNPVDTYILNIYIYIYDL